MGHLANAAQIVAREVIFGAAHLLRFGEETFRHRVSGTVAFHGERVAVSGIAVVAHPGQSGT